MGDSSQARHKPITRGIAGGIRTFWISQRSGFTKPDGTPYGSAEVQLIRELTGRGEAPRSGFASQ